MKKLLIMAFSIVTLLQCNINAMNLPKKAKKPSPYHDPSFDEYGERTSSQQQVPPALPARQQMAPPLPGRATQPQLPPRRPQAQQPAAAVNIDEAFIAVEQAGRDVIAAADESTEVSVRHLFKQLAQAAGLTVE